MIYNQLHVALEPNPHYYGKYSYKIILVPFFHRGKKQLGFKTENYKKSIGIIKGLNALYTRTHRMYYVEHTRENVSRIYVAFKNEAWLDFTLIRKTEIENKLKKEQLKHDKIELPPDKQKLLHEFYDYINSRGFSESTKKTYGNLVSVFLNYFAETDLTLLNVDMVQKFLNEEVVSKGYSKSYHKQMVSSIKGFFKDRFKTKLELENLPRVQSERKLPKVLSVEQIKRIIESTPNIKHKAIIALIYGCGLRVGELVNLKLEHVNTDRMVLEILNAKGFKDRQVPITTKLVSLLREYYKAYRPSFYLFEGQALGSSYTSRSVNAVLKSSAQRAGIKKNVHAHMLRHSFATHLLETGVDTRYIQKLLGHKSSKTTEIYTFVSREKLERIPNPYDQLGL